MTVKNVSFATNFVSPAPRSAPATINCEDWNGWIKATIQRIWIHSVIQLDLYVYNLAMGSGSYSVSTALSMLKSLISVILLCGANTLSKVLRGDGFI